MDMQIQTNVMVNEEGRRKMKKLNEYELNEINGGGISGTLINAITTAGKFIHDLGRALGSTLRRIVGGNYCPI